MRVGEIPRSKGSPNVMRIALLPHSFHTNAPFVGKKDKDLVAWVLVSCRKEVELVPTTDKKGRVQSVFLVKRIERTQRYPSDSRITA